MRKTTTVLALTGMLALGGAASAVASTSDASPAGHPRLSAAAADRSNATASASIAATCSGGVQKRVLVKSNDPSYYFYSGNVGSNLPGVSTTVTGPSSGNDTLLVTFTASDYVSSGSIVGVDVILDGQKMTPVNTTYGTHFIGQSDSGVDSDALQFCKRIGPGSHSMYVRPTFYSGGGTGYAYFYDYSVTAEVAE